ncbi:MAG: hypothetical protein QOD69_1027 [Solirubrobacteraceae bacterium]|jgi:hypothetical protein|nr:hypothetical protein [Solirubrobacteraceae bacterium]
MADEKPQPPRPQRPPVTSKREAAEDRRARQTATAIAAQADLKREAAERRARKSDS